MTVITLPPNDVIRVQNLADLPAVEIDGLIGVVKATDNVYVYDRTTSAWILVGGAGSVTAVTDTNSIDLTVVAGSLSADLRLSSNAADANNTIVALDIEAAGVVGLRAQIANSGLRGLLSATAPVTYNNTTGVIAMPVSTDAVDGYLSAADHTTFNAKVGPTRTISTTAPLAGGGDLSANRTLSITQSATAVDGYLSSVDWNTFNNKVATTRSISTTAPLAGGGNLSADRTLSITQSATAADGYLSSTDWNTFNNKVATTRAINTTAPITGGGNLSADRTLAMAASTNAVDGYLTAADHTTFAAKVSTSVTISTTAPITGGGDLSTNRTFAIAKATTGVDGYLAATDFTTFNNKVATTRLINTTAPITGGGDLSADRTLAMAAATTSVNGYLTSTDWTTFNNKQAAITVGSLGAGNASGLALSAGTLTLHAATATQPGAVSATTQSFLGDKTFLSQLFKVEISASNTSFRALVGPTTSPFTSPSDLQSCSASFSGNFGYLICVSTHGDGQSGLIFAYHSSATIVVLANAAFMLLVDAGTGIYVSKSAASSSISFKNRTGGATPISIVGINCNINTIANWA